MSKPRILVTTAAGKTGQPTALQLLDEGFPVTAFVRRADQRSERLRAKGADIVVGSLTDINDLRRAMAGAQRAYFNTPFAEGSLRAAAVFATVAAEQKQEAVVVLSQWPANPNHPSTHTRAVWLGDQILALLPETIVTTINVGFFADNDLQTLNIAAQFGRLMLPYGSGRNAPPSNEDIARVVAAILARPDRHAGQTYRPTGPRLLSPQDLAAALSKVLGRKVTYVNTPIWMLSKVMQGMGYSKYVIAQFQQYAQDYQRGAFAVNAPTDVVRRITGREPEDFETIARRYLAVMPDARPNVGTQLRLMAMLPIWLLRPGPVLDPSLTTGDFSDRQHASLSAESADWRRGHDLHELLTLRKLL